MGTTLTLGEAGFLLIGAFLLVLVFYLILLIKDTLPVIKKAGQVLDKTSQILDKTDEVAGIVNQEVKGAQKLLEGFGGSIHSAAARAQTSEGLVSTLTVIFGIVMALKSLTKK